MPPQRKASHAVKSSSYAKPEAGDRVATAAGSSSAPPPAKRVRKTADKKGKSVAYDIDASGNMVVQEKRLARWKASCPQTIQQRVDRVMTQRFFMVERSRNGSELVETFKVLGSTGNVYEVCIDKLPTCSCPDGAKGNHCKHILFIFLKVLGVPQTSEYYYQKALLTSELAEIFAAAAANPAVVASNHVREAYHRHVNGEAGPSTSAAVEVQRNPKHKIPEEGDDCAVCYEQMESKNEASLALLVWCNECGNAVHKECFGQWSETAKKKGDKLTCVYCRTPWPKEVPGQKAGVGISDDGYVNLASIAGINFERDYSIYYSGPRRGMPLWKSRNYWPGQSGGRGYFDN